MHATIAAGAEGSAGDRRAHRRLAVAAYDSGQRLVLALGDRGAPTDEDAKVLDRARAALAGARAKP